ncbi:MAG: SGNH/GDSL hydrolase family protein, partial [Rhodothermales bacterium]
RTVYFFGDSFTFGEGVMNEDTALNLLAERIGDQFNVLNYGVMGYSLEQMLARLRSSLDAIEPGDLIVFSPLSTDILRNFTHRVHLCQLMFRKGRFSGESVQSVPVFRNGRWDIIQIREECGFLESLILTSYAMPIGILYRWYRDMKFGDTILDHADQILTEAARLGQQRGGHFVLVFLVTPAECERQAFAVDVHRLKMPFVSLMPFCPEDLETLKSLRFPNDGHWSPEGNRWAARALEQVLRARLPVFQ